MTNYNEPEWHANGQTAKNGGHGGGNGAVGRMSGTFIDSSLRAPAVSPLAEEQQIPDIVIRRLPIYVRTLRKLHGAGVTSVSSEELAERIGVTAAQIRRDLSYFGKFGKQGKGYDTEFLARAIGTILRLDRQWPVALVGLGNLGRAIAGYRGFTPSSFTIVALFDRNPQNIGMVVNDLEMQPEEAPAQLPPAAGAERLAEGGRDHQRPLLPVRRHAADRNGPPRQPHHPDQLGPGHEGPVRPGPRVGEVEHHPELR